VQAHSAHHVASLVTDQQIGDETRAKQKLRTRPCSSSTRRRPSGPSPAACIIETDDIRKEFERIKVMGTDFKEPAPVEAPYDVRATLADPPATASRSGSGAGGDCSLALNGQPPPISRLLMASPLSIGWSRSHRNQKEGSHE
jgi:hypothetical protein